MRIPLIGAMLATAFLLPVTQAAAQGCGGSAAPAMDHSAHAMPAAPATAPATPAAPMACCNQGGAAMAMPADDPAVAMAGLGLVSPGPVFRGKTTSYGVPVR